MGSPSRAQLLGADPTYTAIRNLAAETDALPREELPSGLAWAYGHPGILSHRTKDEQRYNEDLKRAHFIERAKEAGLDGTGPAELRAELLRSTEDDIRQLRSPYEQYGADWPIYNSTRWFSSLPGAAYAGSQILANAVDPEGNHYPHAYDDLAKNVNNFVAVAEPMGVNENHLRDMSDMRDDMASVPWRMLRPGEADSYLRDVYAAKAEPKTGANVLNEAKADQLIGRLGTTGLGAVMDATIDPFFSRAKTGGQFLLDYGLGAAHGTVPAAMEGLEALRDKLSGSTGIPNY